MLEYPVAMGVRSLRETGGQNFIQGDLTSRKIMDYYSIVRFNERGGGGGGAVRLRPIQRTGEPEGGGAVRVKLIQVHGQELGCDTDPVSRALRRRKNDLISNY